MTKKEFFNLIKKFEQGTCSPSEELLLKRYCEEVQIKGFEDSWDLSEKEETKVRLLNRIMDTIEASIPIQRKRSKVWQIAAVCAVLVATGFIYFNVFSSSNIIPPPDDVITLQMQDGTIKIIKENGSGKILGANGNVVGKQNKTSLVYGESLEQKELEYHTLKVPYGKRFQLELSDGSLAHLNSGSSLKYPIQFIKGKNRQVFVKGEAYFEVTKDSLHPFIVNADQLNVKVLGTKFNVHAYGEDNTAEVVLVEGAVGLSTEKEDRSVVLSPGQMGSFDKVNQGISTAPVVTDIYTSWMQGKLVFRDMPFENILKKLERHYDVTIINTNPKLAKEKFNASFDAMTVAKVFESLNRYHGIKYTVTKDTITIK